MWQDQFKGRDFPFPDHPHNLQTKVNRSIWIWENGGVPIEGPDTYGRGLPGTQEDAQCAWVGMPPRLGPPSASRFDSPPKTKASWDQIQKSCPGSRVKVLGEWGCGGSRMVWGAGGGRSSLCILSVCAPFFSSPSCAAHFSQCYPLLCREPLLVVATIGG